MDDAHARRHHLKVPERSLGPAQQRIALAVSLVLTLDVALIRHPRAERVDLHRMVDHEVDRHQRIDAAGIASAAGDRGPQRGQIDHSRHAGEILHDHA